MTKKLTPIEKFNQNIDRHLNAIKNTCCDNIVCDGCVLNNRGLNREKNMEKYGFHCGLAAIRTVISDYRENFKQT